MESAIRLFENKLILAPMVRCVHFSELFCRVHSHLDY